MADIAQIDNGGTATMGPSESGEAFAVEIGSFGGTSGGALEMTGGQLSTPEFLIGEQGSGASATISGGELLVGSSSLFVGGRNGTGTGVLTVNGATAYVQSGDDVQLGRVGTGTLELQSGRMQGFFTVVGKFGTGIWNQSGGLYIAQNDMEIGDGGRPDQSGIAGPRTGTINLSGGILQADGFAIGNRNGTGTVNVSGTGYLAVTDSSGGNIWVGRGMDWTPGTGGATEMRVTGSDAIVVGNQDFLMNVPGVATSSTLIAEITGPDHTTIKVGGNADLTNGTFRVELDGYAPSSGDSWTVLETGADFSAELAVIDAAVAAAGYPALVHQPAQTGGTLMGTQFGTEDLSATLPGGLSWQLDYTTTSVLLSVVGLACDFNNDDLCNTVDINLLTAESAAGTNDPQFDLNGDGLVNVEDVDEWLVDAGNNNIGAPYLTGDADLNGSVDVSDFNSWNGAKFTDNTDWTSGNFNGDASVDVSDFNLWNGTKFTSSGGADASVVPEPSCLFSALLAGIGMMLLRRREGKDKS